MYLPMTGLGIMLAWAAADVVRRYPHWRTTMAWAAAMVGACAGLLSFNQLGHWVDSGALFQHAVDVTRDNHIAHNNLANYYLVQLRNQEAAGHIQEALRIKPTYPEAHINLALLLRRMGKTADSEREYKVALELQPNNPEAHTGYGA